MIWFDFCGHFVNMVYVFTTVYSCIIKKSATNGEEDDEDESSSEIEHDEEAKKYLAYLDFSDVKSHNMFSIIILVFNINPQDILTKEPTVYDDEENARTNVRILIKNLQRYPVRPSI